MLSDIDTVIVAKANAEIEGIPLRTVVMSDVYLERERERRSTFLVLSEMKARPC
jgi:hypothetical protein